MTKKQKALLMVEGLKKRYAEAPCALKYSKDYELLIAVRLSAQCTDKRVNIVAKPLFERFPTIQSFAESDVADVENIIRSCGLYKTKARDIVAMCRMILSEFGGSVPGTIEELTSLPGVGRKTANLIVGDIFGQPAVVTDTHLIRISNRVGLVASKNPYKVEISLKKLLPPEESCDFCHRIVQFGRDVCKAPNPKCELCEFAEICDWHKKSDR